MPDLDPDERCDRCAHRLDQHTEPVGVLAGTGCKRCDCPEFEEMF